MAADNLRSVGKELPRLAARDLVTGRAKFARDRSIPGMLYGKILHSPYPHARIRSIDTSRAEALDGVAAVLTYKNAPGWMFKESAAYPEPHARLLDETVRHVGAAVALVAARTEEIAEEATDLIEVEYELLDAVMDMEEAMKPDAVQLYSNMPGNIAYGAVPNLPQEIHIGDTEAGFGEADEIIEGDTELLNGQNPLPPEPPSIIAEWDGKVLTLRGAMSSPGLCQVHVANATNTAPGNVRIIPAFVGGSYGSKHLTGHVGIAAYAAALAKAAGKPVGIFYTKEEHFAAYQVRMNCKAHIKLGIKKDGTVTACQASQLSECGAYASAQNKMVAVGMITFQNIMKCKNVDYTSKNILTNKIGSGTYRGFGYFETTALVTPVLTMAMEKIGIDPVEYYKKNVINHGDPFFHAYMVPKYEYSAGPDATPIIEDGAKAFGWSDKWKGWGVPTEINGEKRRGVGIGVSGMVDCGEQNSNIVVQLNALGSVTINSGITEFGPGTRDVITKFVAEVLNVPLDMVHYSPSDTFSNPWVWGSTGSRSTWAEGSAAVNATKSVRQQLLEKAAPVFQAASEELDTKDGKVFLKADPEGKALPWAAVLGWQNGLVGHGRFTGRYDAAVYQVQFVEAEVDAGTGEIRILELMSCTDAGRIVNPLAFKGQMDGYFPGLDFACREESVWDKRRGMILNANMIDYRTRTFNELPHHRYVIRESQKDMDENSIFPFGAYGAGEPSISPAVPAISMAVYNAIGKRFFSYPITPAKILQALKERRK